MAGFDISDSQNRRAKQARLALLRTVITTELPRFTDHLLRLRLALTVHYHGSVPGGDTMNAKNITGSANPALSADIALGFHIELTPRIVERFPDGELPVGIHATLRGQDVY